MNRFKSIASLLASAALASAVVVFNLTPARAASNRSDGASTARFDPSAKLNKCVIDFDVVENGRKGMRIKVDFEVTGLKGVDSAVVVRVQDEDEEYRKSKSSYADSNGDLEVKYSLTPGYETAVYDDATLFLPYRELGYDRGTWNLRLDIDLGYEDGDLIQHLTYKNFVFNAPNSAVAAAKDDGDGDTAAGDSAGGEDDASAEIKEVWVEQNVTDRGRKGMRIHLSFDATGLKDREAQIVVRFQRADDTYLRSTTLRNKNGELQVSYRMLPKFDPAAFDDATIFVPYDAFKVGSGASRLKMDIDLSDADGELIAHLKYHNFTLAR